MSATWVRRVYDDRRYADGARHVVLSETATAVVTGCGRTLPRITDAKVANRLVPSPESLIRSDIATCPSCRSHAGDARAVTDVVVTVPKGLWADWIEEGDLPGDPPSGYTSHFWIAPWNVPTMNVGDRVYIVAHGRLRGFAPLRAIERSCELDPYRACLLRDGDAEAITVPEPIIGFRGWRYRWWDRDIEVPFPGWQTP